MEFFVPNAARNYFEELLNGRPGEFGGVLEMVAALQESVGGANPDSVSGTSEPQQALRNPFLAYTGESDPDRTFRDSLKVWKKVQKNIESLTQHGEMRHAYGFLQGELESEQQWRAFLSSAIRANISYTQFRDAIKKYKKLYSSLARAVTTLDETLSEINQLGLDNIPIEFSSPRHLLLAAESEDWTQDRLNKWCQVRGAILGQIDQPPSRPTALPVEPASSTPLSELVMEYTWRANRDAEVVDKFIYSEDTGLETAWGVAPRLTTLLRTLSRVAKEYAPSPVGAAASALKRQKPNAKYEFLRAFDHLLTEKDILSRSADMLKAMAIITEVILNDAAISVSYDDARKAIE